MTNSKTQGAAGDPGNFRRGGGNGSYYLHFYELFLRGSKSKDEVSFRALSIPGPVNEIRGSL